MKCNILNSVKIYELYYFVDICHPVTALQLQSPVVRNQQTYPRNFLLIVQKFQTNRQTDHFLPPNSNNCRDRIYCTEIVNCSLTGMDGLKIGLLNYWIFVSITLS